MTSDKCPLDELIDEMIKEQNHNPRDCSFRLITRRYPKNHIKHLIFPENMQIESKQKYTQKTENLHMDCAQLVIPDDEDTNPQ